MTTVAPTNLNVLAPIELDRGDRVIGWVDSLDPNHTERTFTDIPWDDSYDREWTVEYVATGSNREVRVNFIDGSSITFESADLIVVTR